MELDEHICCNCNCSEHACNLSRQLLTAVLATKLFGILCEGQIINKNLYRFLLWVEMPVFLFDISTKLLNMNR